MALGEHVFLYCERGASEALLAEPINAASNLGFIAAAIFGLMLVLRRGEATQRADQFLLVGLVFLIGLGSFGFHLFANRWSELGDVVPIGLFMLVYLGFALNRFLGVPPGWTTLIVTGFVALAAATVQLKCFHGGIGFPDDGITGVGPCLNGSVGYLPALIALLIVGALMRERKHPSAVYVLWAALVLAVSIAFRSVDLALCDTTVVAGHRAGTHGLWHLLNAVVLFLLIRASLEKGPAEAG
jgi:hypothetical protein